ncbi:MAG: hypothetical protein KY468_16700 [Armatimonadetes bacterium]|nr:hypothetical protein [Armatimonadota bacterium]
MIINGVWVALVFVLSGLMVVGFGTWRYLETERMLARRKFRPLGPRMILVSLAFAIIGVVVLFYLWGKIA